MAKQPRSAYGLGLGGPTPNLNPAPIIAQRAPTANDVGYEIMTQWLDEPNDDIWQLTKVAGGVASWDILNSMGPGTSPISRYVVDSAGTAGYVTIQAALDAANAAGVAALVYVRSGTYTENLTFYDNIWLQGDNESGTVIAGTHTPPASGTLNIFRCLFQSATDIFNSAVAGTTDIIMEDCAVNVTNGYVFNLVNWTGSFVYFDIGSASTNDGVVNNTGGADVFMTDATIGAGVGNTMIVSGNCTFFNIHFQCPITIQGAGANVINGGSWLDETLTTAATATLAITNSRFATGANAAISHGSAGVISLSEVVINSSNATPIGGAGAGVMTLGSVTFPQNSAIAGTLTVAYSRATDRNSPFIVGDTGNYETIQAAINDANTIGNDALIIVQPGTFTEDLTLYDGQTIQGSGLDTVITGVVTPPDAGTIAFNDLTMTSTTDIVTSAAAGTTRMTFYNVAFNTDNGYIVDCANWTGTIDIIQCGDNSTINGIVNNQGTSVVNIWDSSLGAGATNIAKSGGTLDFRSSRINIPVIVAGATTTAAHQGNYFADMITVADTSTLQVSNSSFVTGANAAVTQSSTGIIQLTNTTIDSSANPCIAGAGAGEVYLSGVEFLDGSNLAATLTMNYGPETRTTKIIAGDSTYRVNVFGLDSNIIQAYCDDATASGASALSAVEGNMTVSSGDGSHSPVAVTGALDMISGSNALTTFGVQGYCEQSDGSVIASTAAGAEGWLNLEETDIADLPAYLACGVKGYLDGTAGTAVPAGMVAGVASLLEYYAYMDSKAYGVLVSRLDTPTGSAGVAAAAAFGTVQGTNAIPDFLYGLDFAASTSGFTNADVRFQNSSTIAVDTEGVTFSGDVATRSSNPTNTNIESFDVDVILQSKANTGGVPTGANGDYNIMYMQDRTVMEQFIIAAGGETIIAPRLTDDGLLISLDLTNAEGCELYFGHTTRSRHSFTIGTDAAFFVEASFKVVDAGSSDPLWVGFRKRGAPNAVFANYTDAGVIGLHQTTNADTVIIGSNLNAGGWAYVNTTDAFADNETHVLRMNVSDAGVCTYLIDGVAPSSTQALTFDNGDVVIPFVHHLFIAAGGAPSAITMQSFKCGYQSWV